MEEDHKRRYDYWINGKTFNEISNLEDVTINTVVSSIIRERGYILWDYFSIHLNDKNWGDIVIVDELQRCLESYAYSDKKSPLYTFLNTGIYKENEDLLRDFWRCYNEDGFIIKEKDRYKKCIRICSISNKDFNYNTKLIEMGLNKVPSFFDLIGIIKSPVETGSTVVMGLYSVPLLTMKNR